VEFQFRHNNRREADILGKAIEAPEAEAHKLAGASEQAYRRQQIILYVIAMRLKINF
jgi:hypothetical protein